MAVVLGRYSIGGSQALSDFSKWSRESLEQFARDAAQENRILTEQVAGLLRAYRAEVVRNARATASQPTNQRHSDHEKRF